MKTVWILVAAATLAVGCTSSQPQPETEAAPGLEGGDRYEVRGLIVGLSDEAGGGLRIQHEAIPDFKGMDGKVWEGGMESMTMAFAVADGVSLEGISAGDKVEFNLVVDWAKRPTQAITEIVKLPAETELDFVPTTEAPR
jgi:Cu/Ag efflux protein CusF